MTTEREAHAFLTDLHRLAQALDQAVLDSGMPAPSGDNAGCAPVGPKSKLPCSTNLLDQQADLTARVQPICANLAMDLTIHGRPFGAPDLAPWVAWLRRHRVDLIARDWWTDSEDELRRVHRELADQFNPPLTTRENLPVGALPPRLTEQEICDAYNVRPATVRSWRNRGKIRDTGATKRVLVRGEAEHHRLFERCDGTPWPTA